MKNFFNKIKSYSFWVSFSAALIMLLNSLGKAFGFEIENQVVEDVVMSVAGILVVFGIVTMNDTKKNDQKTEEGDSSQQNSQENDVDEEQEDEKNNQ